MDHNRRPPSLVPSSSSPAHPVSTSPSPQHRQSQSPFRYIQLHPANQVMDEKATPLINFPSDHNHHRQPGPSVPPPESATRTDPRYQSRSQRPYRPRPSLLSSPSASPLLRQPTPSQVFSRSLQTPPSYTRPRGLRIANLIKPWIPIILYGITTLAFIVAIALYKTQVFTRLDELSHWLQSDERFGHAILFILIFITTFPPVPLYSTLITLSGYTFGPWIGAVISYFAALSGALTVFLLSRTFFRESISRWLSSTTTIKRVVQAVEKRPKLLFLIRLAPYPYNVMNCLLAAAPTLTLRTYTICTALSLFKVIIHTTMGASIQSFKDHHIVDTTNPTGEKHEHTLGELWTVLGVILCIAILIYLSVVARKAVDEELNEDRVSNEETVAFLSPDETSDLESGRVQPMVESPFRSGQHISSSIPPPGSASGH